MTYMIKLSLKVVIYSCTQCRLYGSQVWPFCVFALYISKGGKS